MSTQPSNDSGPTSEAIAAVVSTRSPLGRTLWIALGWFFVALGAIGVALPIMPTVPFLIVAAWAFGKGSERWRNWLWSHPLFGTYLRVWHRYGVIPPRAKALAVVALSGSLVLMWLIGVPIYAIAGAAAIMAAIILYILSRPSRPPADAPSEDRYP
jgi:uncharacterized membrane protein YbaN (DUF454 family)